MRTRAGALATVAMLSLALGNGSMALDPRTLGKGKTLRLRLLVSDGLTTAVVNARPITLAAR